MRDIPITRMGPEKLCLAAYGLVHGFTGVYILLTPIDDTDEAELERVDPTGEDVKGVGTGVHQVEFG